MHDIREAVRRNANAKLPLRASVAMVDPRVDRILGALRKCGPAGDRRRNWLNGATVAPRVYVQLLDDLHWADLSPEQALAIMALGDAMRDAAYETVKHLVPNVTAPEALAREALIDGESQAAVAMLSANPQDPHRLREVAEHLGRERDAADQARDAVLEEAVRLESKRSA